MTHIELGESIRPLVPSLLINGKSEDVSLQFMLLHVHCADFQDGLMKFSEGESKQSKYQDSSEFVLDDDDNEIDNPVTRIVLFGSSSNGNSICISVRGYRPWIRVQVREGMSDSEVKLLKSFFEKNARGSVHIALENRKKFYGWQPDPSDATKTRTFAFAKVSFDSFADATKAANKCKASSFSRPTFILDLVDVQIKSNSRFCNDLGLTLSDWVQLKKSSSSIVSFSSSNWASHFSNCQIEVECDVSAIAPVSIADNRIAPLLLASIDGEMFSDDGAFPDFLKGDNTIYIGVSLWFYGSPLTSIKRVMFCVSDANPTPDPKPLTPEMHLFHFRTSRELFEGFRDFLVACDPDVLTGWNTFGFDYPFMYGEYKQSYLPQGERGSEKLQIALLSRLSDDHVDHADTAAELVSRVRASPTMNYTTMSNWIAKLNYSVGISNVNALLKEEKVLRDKKGSTRNISSFSSASASSSFCSSPQHVDDEDDESDQENEEDYVSSSTGLSSHAAKIVRNQILDDYPSLNRCDWTDAFSQVKKMSVSSQTDFKATILQHFPVSISSMLLQKRPLKIVQRGLFLSRFANEKCILVEKRMSSAARGDNVYSYIGMTGRINIDLMQIIKDDKKPESNTLKFASKLFLNQADQEKIDLSASDMFAAYKSGDLKKRWEIAEYCARDCDIPLLLISKLSYMPTWIEMSRVCYTSFHDVVNSGQQVKVMNLIARFVKDEYAINLRDSGWPDNELDEDEKTNSFRKVAPDYEGATVIEPATGFYEDCVSTLDFESLYPSIIRYFNLCPSTLVLDADVLALAALPDSKVSFETHVIKNNVLVNRKLLKYEIQDRKYTFVMHVTGVLPSLLKRLIDARKAVKKLMNESKDPAERAVLNGRQNGLKVACNSCYGFCGVSKKRGLMPCKPVAAVTTLKGRLFIDFSKNFTEKTYPGSKVIYGDSVSGDTALILQINGVLVTRRIDELVKSEDQWISYGTEKEAVEFLNAVQVWTESGFTQVQRIIRHKCKKRMFRILTHWGLVDATEDHSLLDENSIRVTPMQVNVGNLLLHAETLPTHSTSAPPDVITDLNEAWAMGLFMADGSADYYQCPSGSKSTWAINKADHALLELAASRLTFSTVIIDSLESSGVYKLVPHGGPYGSTVALCKRYRDLFYNKCKEKIVPEQILCASIEVVQAFFNGFYAGDGDHGGQYIRVDQKGKQSCTGLILLAHRLGFSTSLNERADKPNIFRFTCTRGNQRKPGRIIKRIYELPVNEGYVYDLETESNHFHVGPGRLIVHNTDSVMVLWGKGTTVERANELGEEAANKITSELREGKVTEIGGAGSLSASISSSSQEWRGRKDLAEACSAVRLTNEKVYFPYLLLKKKNYAAIKFTSDGKGGFKEELDLKGIDAVRRDRSQLVRDASNAILHSLLYERSVVSAMKVLRQQLQDMAEGKVPIQAFVLSKSLKSNYSSSNLPHVMAWKRMLDRGDEGAPPVGARMPYVILADSTGMGGKETAAKLYERSEHPDFAVSSGRKLDYPYYIESLFNPLYKLLQFCNVQDLKSIFRDSTDLASNKLKNVTSLKRFLSSSEPERNAKNGITISTSSQSNTNSIANASKAKKPRQNPPAPPGSQQQQPVRNLAHFFQSSSQSSSSQKLQSSSPQQKLQ